VRLVRTYSRWTTGGSIQGAVGLRVHSASGIGIPLLGDPVYGDGKGAWRTMLHAVALDVDREGKQPISAIAPWPAEFATLGFSDG